LIDFISAITIDTFDSQKFVEDEMIKILAKIQAIILEDKPSNIQLLNANTKYSGLKASDLIVFSNLNWDGNNFELKGSSATDFEPSFQFTLASNKGITNTDTIVFNN